MRLFVIRTWRWFSVELESAEADRPSITNMDVEELVRLHGSMGRYIKDTFRLSHNDELMGSCRDLSTELVVDEDNAVAVIIGALRLELYRSHRLRVVR